MVRMTKRIALAALLGAGLALGGAAVAPSPAAAQGWYGHPAYGHVATPGLDRHRWQQERWQRHGMATGRISPREAWRIDRAQSGLARHQAWARADGVVTPHERWALRGHARRVDGLIARSMRDGYGHHYGRGW
jgi:hypothetical protein